MSKSARWLMAKRLGRGTSPACLAKEKENSNENSY